MNRLILVTIRNLSEGNQILFLYSSSFHHAYETQKKTKRKLDYSYDVEENGAVIFIQYKMDLVTV